MTDIQGIGSAANSFAITDGSKVVVTADSVYTQCPKALVRSHLWDASRHVEESRLPSSGTIMKSLQQGFDGDSYDRNYPQRLKETIY